MTDKPTYEALQERVRELEAENHRLAVHTARVLQQALARA
jgi:hypothetical protein